jgi:hypothetical protein
LIHWLAHLTTVADLYWLATLVRRRALLPRLDCPGDIEIIGAIAHCL